MCLPPNDRQVSIGLSRAQVTKIQREWNDSPLSFAEIADRVEREMFSGRGGTA